MRIKPLPVRTALALAVGSVIILLTAGRAGAQSVSGFAINRSTWDNAALTPPGDGSGAGDLRVGVWSGEGDLLGPPLMSVVAASTAVLPLANGAAYAYLLGPLGDGNYRVAAWIDGDGNAAFDPGEPRSPAVAFIIAAADSEGLNLAIVDDTDSDGIADWWEVYWFGNLQTATATSDYDRDGLTDLQEFEIAVSVPGMLALSPTNWDTDGDGMDDGWEWQYYAGGAGLHPCIADADGDVDGDGLTNLQEYRGVDGVPRMRQDPNKAPGIGILTGSSDDLNPLDLDTDNDGLIDSFEFAWYDPGNGIDPRVAGDLAADPDRDGLTNFREQCLHAPFREGGVNELWRWGVAQFPERDPVTGIRAFSPPLNLGTAGLIDRFDVMAALRNNADWTRPSNFDAHYDETVSGWDTDGDLLPDGWEVEFGLDPRSGDLFIAPGVPNPDGFLGDPDGDGLINIQEYYGQDGQRSSDMPYINGSGDETNPNRHAWWHNLISLRQPNLPSTVSFLRATRQHGGGVVAGPLPTLPLGWDPGLDTDDNGIPDALEIQGEYDGAAVTGSSPVHSMDPFRMRSARIILPAGISIPDPLGAPLRGYRPDLIARSWTLECWVKIDAAGRSGNLIDLPGPIDDHGSLAAFTARLALDNDVPSVAFQTIGGKEYRAFGLALPVGEWVHLAGVWNQDDNALSLFVDGIFAQSIRVYEESVASFQYAMRTPPRLADSSAAGGAFVNNLRIDEVRIWGVARSADQIEQSRRDLVNPYAAAGDLLAYYRFDDGGLMAEDFMRKARSSLLGGEDYLFGDRGYALAAGTGFEFDATDVAVVYGVDTRGADDTSGDGLPDPWKMINHLDVFSATGVDGRDGDPDGDGLSNIYEYWSRTNPRKTDTTGNGVPDAWEDFDGDGVPNVIEQQYGTRPDMVDTDNNGFTDAEEIAMGTDPINPLDPLISRCMQFGGAAGDYLEIPIQAKQRLSSWTLEAWLHPTAGAAGTVIRRTVQRLPDTRYAANWLLTVEPAGANALIARGGFITVDGGDFRVATAPFPAGAWIHLAAVYDASRSLLQIYANGVLSTETNVLMATPPVNGKGGESFVRIGEAFSGRLDEIRVWNTVRSAAEIAAYANLNLEDGMGGLIHYFRFDDGQANEDSVPFGEFHQAYGPQDFTHPEDWHNQWRHAAGMRGNVLFASPGALVAAPALRVMLQPPAAVSAGAQWALDGGAWRNSGDIVQNLDRVDLTHFLGYRPIVGWQAPIDEAVEVTNGVLTTLTRTYTRYGTLTVGLEPLAARNAGAQWRVAGGPWLDPGAATELPPGQYTVNYSPIPGWATPPDETVTIVSAQVSALTRIYTGIVVSGQITNLSVWGNAVLTPPGDGTGGGSLLVGAWAGNAGLHTPPQILMQVAVASAGTLPLPLGAVYSYSLGPMPTGDYRVAAWIDGNASGVVDLGEPVSAQVALTLQTDSLGNVHLAVGDDSDGDGMADWWEVHWFDDLITSDGTGDSDGDGLTDLEEFQLAMSAPSMITLSPLNWDSDGDLLPDGWEVEFGLNPCSGDLLVSDGAGGWISNPDGFLGDPDGDGLINYQEFLGADGARDPSRPYILGTGDETNPNEYTWKSYRVTPRPWPHYLPSATNFWTLAAAPLAGRNQGGDTSDNGIADADAIRNGDSPVHSMDPFVKRSARIIDPAGIALPDPVGDAVRGYRPDLVARAWTLECWVRPAQAGLTGDLIMLPGPIDDAGANVAFSARLALDNGAPWVAFQTLAGHAYRVSGLALPAGHWTHLAGVWDPGNNALTLYVNGLSVQSLRVYEDAVSALQYAMRAPPRLADASAAAGAFVDNLHLDEVRIWQTARNAAEIEAFRSELVSQYDPDLLAYFRFDDGGLTAEDFTRKAASRLIGGGEFLYGDWAYAPAAGVGFEFDATEFARVHGVDDRGADDTDGDGLPDAWEIVNHLDPFSAAGNHGAMGDPDGDGLWNLYEYWAGTNPNQVDTLGDGIPDADRDPDNDGLSNLEEQRLGTHPRLPDTADNGLLDGDRLRDAQPARSLIPVIDRVLRLDGAAGSYVTMPDQARFALNSWTLQTWALPSAAAGGSLIARRMQNDVVNYELSVTSEGRPRVRFTAGTLTTNLTLTAASALPLNAWSHLAATFDGVSGYLRLYVNGQLQASLQTGHRPARSAVGPVTARVGEGWSGYLDEIAIFDRALSADDLMACMPGLALQTNLVGLLAFYRFDDGTSATGPDGDGRWFGTSGNPDWWWGQVEDFAPGFENDWLNQWRNAGTLAGNVAMVSVAEDPALTQPSPVNYADTDSNGDGIPDWWYVQYGYDPLGPSVAEEDPDGDGISNYWEYRLGGDPFEAYSMDPQGLQTDAEWDSDGDGLPNWDEINVYRTDPTLWDTDDDGYGDGDELSDAFIDADYGFSRMHTDPLNARSPLIRRSLRLGGNRLVAPRGERFSLIPDEDLETGGPEVTLTRPAANASVNVRFVEIAGTVQSDRPLRTIRVYNNTLFVQHLTTDAAGNFEATLIITAGENLLEVLAVDEDGGAGRAFVRVTGNFPRADIRVTQNWDVPGDLDTWLIDPSGRHMGWTTSGPGYPSNVSARIPNAFLDIDDIPGTGPENITVEQGAAIAGQYEVWMNNFSHQGNPQSTVRVLVHDGTANEQYVEFGPHPMKISDNNGMNSEAWWLVTTIAWPSGQMTPPGRIVGATPGAGEGDDGLGEITQPGWTIEAWIKPGDAQQSGAIASYRLPDGRLPYVVGLTNNRPFVRIRSMGGAEYILDAAPLPSNTWTHLAFVFSEPSAQQTTLHVYTNGVEVAARAIPLPVLKGIGTMTVDAGYTMPDGLTRTFDAAYLDELRFWSRARGRDALISNMHRHLDTTPSLLAYYSFDDGGLGIEDATRPRDRRYDLGGFPLPDDWTDPKPGWDGIWGTTNDIPDGPGSDGHNDYVTAWEHAPVVVGALQVWIEPEGAELAGAEWRLAGGTWQANGAVVGDLELGRYTIEFSAIPPWMEPAPLSVNLTAGTTVAVTGRYAHVSGVQVIIQPPEVLAAGAGWRFVGGTDWYASGRIVERNVGFHTVEFRSVDGWLAPGTFTAVVSNDTVNTSTWNYFLMETIGLPGSDTPGQFNFPRGLALDADRNLYVADSGNHRVQVRDPVSAEWTVLGSAGEAPGQFRQPFGVGIDGVGRVYIADANNNRIQRYDPAAGAWTVWGGPGIGDEPGQFNGPFDVAVDAQTNIYVADHYNHRVQKRSPDGAWKVLIGSGFATNQTRLPSGLAVDGNSLILADHRAETGVSRVRRFSLDGEFIEEWPATADGLALNKPRSPFRASDDSLLMADMVNNRILRFRPSAHRWEVLIGGSVLKAPEGVAMDAPGFIYIADTANHRLLRLGMSGYSGQVIAPFPTARPYRGTATAGGGHGFVIRWQGQSGWLYVVQFRDDLYNGAVWRGLPGAERIEGIDCVMEVIDPDNAFERILRFYRILAY